MKVKRALVIGSSTSGLQEAIKDAEAWKGFLEAPGRWTWEQDGNTILPNMIWLPIRGADNQPISPYEVHYIMNECVSIEEIETHIGWLQKADDRVFITSNHGFRLMHKGKPLSGFYFGKNCVYTFGCLQEKVFRYLEGSGRLLRIHDMCFAGGAKKIKVNSMAAEYYLLHPIPSFLDPTIKGFEITPDEIQSKYVKDETPQGRDTVAIVAAKRKEPAYGMVMGGSGSHNSFSTEWQSLFTHAMLSAIRRLMPAGVNLQVQGINAIVSLANTRCNMIKYCNKGNVKVPTASVKGKNQLLFTN